MNRWIAVVTVAALFGAGFVPTLGAPGAAQAPPPADLFVREDPDGVLTIIAIIEDVFGRITYEDVAMTPTTNVEDAAVRAYANEWTRTVGGRSYPMVTYGYETEIEGEVAQRVRMPYVVIENATADSPMFDAFTASSAQAEDSVAGDVLAPQSNMLSFLGGFLLPSVASTWGSSSQHPSNTGAYRTEPTYYMWFALRESPERTWAGLYVERIGSHSGSSTSSHESVEMRTEMGAVTRTASGEERWGGVFIGSEATRDRAPTHLEATNRHYGGIHLLGLEQGVFDMRAEHEADDASSGGVDSGFPQYQHDHISLGTSGSDGEYMPLVGMRTENTLHHPDDPNAQTHTVSIGTYEDGEYRPLIGTQRQFERFTFFEWALVFALAGGPGDQNSGDWSHDVGTFDGEEFVPVAGMQFTDGWDDAQYAYQTMLAFGVYVDGDFEPVFAVAYSGERTFGDWTFCNAMGTDTQGAVVAILLAVLGGGGIPIGGGLGSQCNDWEIVMGTFVNDRLQPILTIDFKDDFEGAKYANQAMITIGTSVAGERVPLLGYTFSSETPLTHWSLDWALGGTIGSKSTDWRMELGTFVGTVFKPLVTLDYKDDYAGADHQYQAMIIIGTVVEGKEQPLLAYTYDGQQTLLDWTLAFANGGGFGAMGALDWEMEIGTFVDHTFVPLVGWTYANDFEGARYPHQSEMTVGIYPLGRYQPVFGFTYDAERPFQQAMLELQGERGDGLVAIGTYAGDRYMPLVGISWDSDQGDGTADETYVVGTFLLGYGTFIPLAGLDYEGRQPVGFWLVNFAAGGPGGAADDARLRAQAYLIDEPVAGVSFGYDETSTSGSSRSGTTTAGLILPGDKESPRLAVRYAGESNAVTHGLAVARGIGQDCSGCGTSRVTVGIEDPKTGAFTPLVGIRSEGMPADQPHQNRWASTLYVYPPTGGEVALLRAAFSHDGDSAVRVDVEVLGTPAGGGV